MRARRSPLAAGRHARPNQVRAPAPKRGAQIPGRPQRGLSQPLAARLPHEYAGTSLRVGCHAAHGL